MKLKKVFQTSMVGHKFKHKDLVDYNKFGVTQFNFFRICVGICFINFIFLFQKCLALLKPYRFQLGLGEVIPGWDQALVGMCAGEKWRLFIPATLAYGTGGGTPETPGG